MTIRVIRATSTFFPWHAAIYIPDMNLVVHQGYPSGLTECSLSTFLTDRKLLTTGPDRLIADTDFQRIISEFKQERWSFTHSCETFVSAIISHSYKIDYVT